VLKVFFALGGSIQEVADFVYHTRNLTIGYLHLVFLGIITPFFFQQIANELELSRLNKYRESFLAFYICFLGMEGLLGLSAVPLRGSTAIFVSDLLVYTTWFLAAATLYLLIYFAREHLKRNR
jgi:hypothetical protein